MDFRLRSVAQNFWSWVTECDIKSHFLQGERGGMFHPAALGPLLGKYQECCCPCLQCSSRCAWNVFVNYTNAWMFLRPGWMMMRYEPPWSQRCLESRNLNLSPTGGSASLVLWFGLTHVLPVETGWHLQRDQNKGKSQTRRRYMCPSWKRYSAHGDLWSQPFRSWEKWHSATTSKGSRRKMCGIFGMPTQALWGERKYLH